jgi:RNA polymerase sigma factor (sigma-70 family)
MRDDPAVIALVKGARDGDRAAWDALVERYSPLVWGICRRYGLPEADAADVSQNVWMLVVTKLPMLREPAALPGWLATTTLRECVKISRADRHARPSRPEDIEAGAPGDGAGIEEEVLTAELHAALREALAALPLPCRRLLTALFSDPRPPYAEISQLLGLPVPSIGPTRQRCLQKLRRHPAVAALLATEEQG